MPPIDKRAPLVQSVLCQRHHGTRPDTQKFPPRVQTSRAKVFEFSQVFQVSHHVYFNDPPCVPPCVLARGGNKLSYLLNFSV